MRWKPMRTWPFGSKIGLMATDKFCCSPTIDDVQKTVVNFVKDGKPNMGTPYIQFPWNQFNITVLTQTPVLGTSLVLL